MAVVRRNILSNFTVRQKYIQGVKLLKQEFPGSTTSDFGIAGPARQVSTYDLFIIWHHIAMFTFTPPSQSDRNVAHRGPVFLPWHRFMLILLELQLQRVLNDQDFGLPYWDWAADGERSPSQQAASPVWGNQCMGGQGNPVSTGPFAFNAADLTTWRIQVDANVNGQLRATNRGLRRAFAQTASTLPNKGQVATAVNQLPYDAPRGAPPRRASATAWRGGDRRIPHQGFTTSSTCGLVATCSPPPLRTTLSSTSTIATSTESGQLGWSATSLPMCQTRQHPPHSAATALTTQ